MGQFKALSRVLLLVWSIVVGLTVAAPADAQTVSDLFNTITLSDFLRVNFGTPDVADAIRRTLAAEVATYPIPSSATGVIYEYDPAIGAAVRSTKDFGPTFAERPATGGRGRVSLGFDVQSVTFQQLQGQDLRSGTFPIYLAERQTGDSFEPWFAVDIGLDISTFRTILFASYGISDHLDVALAAPYTTMSVRGLYRFTDLRDPSPTVVDSTLRVDVAGVGDLVVRAKYRITEGAAGGLGLLYEATLPTGSKEDWLGSGRARHKLMLLADGKNTEFSPHVNLGYAVGGAADEFDYTIGLTRGIAGRLTFAADLVGRYVTELGTIVPSADIVPTDLGPFRVTTQRELGQHTNLLLGSAGIKWNFFQNALADVNVTFSLNDSGLRAGISPTFGISYTF